MIVNEKISAIYLKLFFLVHLFYDVNGILAGHIAPPNTLRYQVSVFYLTEHICGGSLISLRHVLTAAHCVFIYVEPTDYNVKSGSPSLLNYEGRFSSVISIRSANFSIPLDPVPELVEHDMAILTLDVPLTCSESTAPIGFLEEPMNFPSTAFFLFAGWGFPGPSTQLFSHTLKYTFLKLADSLFCSLARTVKSSVTEMYYCIDHTESVKNYRSVNPPIYKGVSKGDSGGALIFNNVIIGVLTISRELHDPSPVLFTKIHPYAPSIKRILDLEWPTWRTSCHRPDMPSRQIPPINYNNLKDTWNRMLLKRHRVRSS